MDQTQKVLLIMGSTRNGRLCPKITAWVESVGRASTANLDFEVIDLVEWHLPMDDEPDLPHKGIYSQPHTQAWSDKINSSAALVFVTPQYNWGYPAVLKNAIDHLYNEWRGKPLLVVTYGGHGGAQCGLQLRSVATRLKMQCTDTFPEIVLSDPVIREGAILTPEVDFVPFVHIVERGFQELVAKMNSAAN